MIEALWSMKVSVNNAPVNAGGVVVIETGRIFGGDSSFIWTGQVTVHDSIATARVHVRQYQKLPGITSITGMEEYWATFTGKTDRERMVLVGTPDKAPQIKLIADLVRRAELP